MTPPASLLRTLATACNDAYALAFPVACAACGTAGVALCDGCRRALTPSPHSVHLGDGLTVHSGLAFEGVTAATLRALKQDGLTGLARHLAPALGAAVGATLAAGELRAGRVVVVPIPTSRASMRKRGYGVVEQIARRACIRTTALLAPARRTRDQRELGRDARRENVRGAFRMRDPRGVSELDVVLIDDVVTTGATLHAAARGLRDAGAHVIGAATVAATLLRVTQSGDGSGTPGRIRDDRFGKDG